MVDHMVGPGFAAKDEALPFHQSTLPCTSPLPAKLTMSSSLFTNRLVRSSAETLRGDITLPCRCRITRPDGDLLRRRNRW